MSPAARDAAQSLGYLNAKVYHDGIPAWTKAHALALSPKLLKEAWLDKQQPLVLLDARKKAAGGVIPGAVAFPEASKAALDRLYKLRKLKPPIVVYDDGDGAAAGRIAGAIVKEGYVATVLTGGVKAWQAAGYELAKGAPAQQLVFVPKPKAGAIPVAEFKTLAADPPADIVLLDVRNPDEVAAGALRGAVNIPVDQLAGRAAELPREKRIVAHCSTGTRAEMAYHVLQGAGFPKVAFLDASVEFEGGKALVGE